MKRGEIAIFAPDSNNDFGERVGAHLGLSLSAHEERIFEDGEHKMRPLVNVRGRDVFVIQSLYGDERFSVNDKLCRMLFFLGALRDASAERITAVVPYLCYSRKDRKTKPRDPVTTRYIAGLFEAVGTDRLITMDVHNLAAFQNAFRIRTDHLEAKKLFVDYFAPLVQGEQVVVVSPDTGGVKRAEDFRRALTRAIDRDVSSAFLEKYRSDGLVSGETVVGEVSDMVAIIIDDLISSGTTLQRAADSIRARGAKTIYAAATHGLFNENANKILSAAPLERILITDTVPAFRLDPDLALNKLAIVGATSLFAEAIERINSDGSITELLET